MGSTADAPTRRSSLVREHPVEHEADPAALEVVSDEGAGPLRGTLGRALYHATPSRSGSGR